MLKSIKPHPPTMQAGFTLVELMVALVAGLLVVGAGVAMLSSAFGSNSSALRMTKMNQDLRGILNAISNDIQRAGGWAISPQVSEITTAADLQFSATSGTITVSSLATASVVPYPGFVAPLDSARLTGRVIKLVLPDAASPFTVRPYELTISAVPSSSSLTVTVTFPAGGTLPANSVRAGSWTILNPFRNITVDSNNCILFSYDLDADGALDTNERFGYRFDGTDAAIQTTTTATACTAGAAWQNITDENVLTINQFAINQTTTPTITVGQLTTQVREYSLALGGQLESDTTAQRNLRTVVQVRNHLVQ